ncbi:MAG: hypothetical protein RL095_3038 [Verrucomicrobiota bacterium]|jgi:hypothetical protein
MKLLLWLRDHPWKTLGLCCVGGLFVLIYLFCFWDIDPVPTPPELEVRTPQVAPEKNAYTVLMKHAAWFEANKAPQDGRERDALIADDAKMISLSSNLQSIRGDLLKAEFFVSPKMESFNESLTHLGTVRQVFNQSQNEAFWHLKSGKTSEAVQVVRQMQDLLRQHKEPQSVIESLVLMAISGITLHTALATSSYANPKERLSLASNWVELSQRQEWWRCSLAGESRLAYSTSIEIRQGNPIPDFDHIFIRILTKPELLKSMHQDMMLKLIPCVNIPLDSVHNRNLDKEIAELKHSAIHSPSVRSANKILLCMLVPALSTVGKKFIALETALRLHQSRCACLNYQDTHAGQPPPDLTTLVQAGLLKEIPIDPWDGKPLRYDASRGILWSVGDNLTDEGGTPNGKFSVLLGEEVPDLAAMNAGGGDVVLPLKLKAAAVP